METESLPQLNQSASRVGLEMFRKLNLQRMGSSIIKTGFYAILKTSKSFLFWGVSLAKKEKEIDQSLYQITGSAHFSRFLDEVLKLMMPKILDCIDEKLHQSSFPGNEVVSDFLSGDQHFWQQLVSVFIKTGIINFAERTIKRKSDHPSELLVNMVSDLLEEFYVAFDSMNLKEMRSEGYEKDFRPFSQHLLSLFFPGGETELPFGEGLNRCFWSVLHEYLAPMLFSEMFEELMIPYDDKKDMPAIKAAIEILMNYFSIKQHISPAIPEIVTMILMNLKAPESRKIYLKGWLQSKLTRICDSQDPHVIKLWELGKQYLGQLIYSVLKNCMSDEGQLSIILEKMFTRIGDYVLHQPSDQMIQSTTKELLAALGLTSARDLPLSYQFQPLVWKILSDRIHRFLVSSKQEIDWGFHIGNEPVHSISEVFAGELSHIFLVTFYDYKEIISEFIAFYIEKDSPVLNFFNQVMDDLFLKRIGWKPSMVSYLQKVLTEFFSHLFLCKDSASKSTEEIFRECKEAFSQSDRGYIQFSQRLLKLGGKESAETLPLPRFLQTKVYKLLSETLLSLLWQKIEKDLFTKINKKIESRGEAEDKFCQEIAKEALPYIQSYLIHHLEDLVKFLNQTFERNHLSLEQEKFLIDELTAFLKSREPILDVIWHFVEDWLHKVILYNLYSIKEKLSTVQGIWLAVFLEVFRLLNLETEQLDKLTCETLSLIGLESHLDVPVPFFLRRPMFKKLNHWTFDILTSLKSFITQPIKHHSNYKNDEQYIYNLAHKLFSSFDIKIPACKSGPLSFINFDEINEFLKKSEADMIWKNIYAILARFSTSCVLRIDAYHKASNDPILLRVIKSILPLLSTKEHMSEQLLIGLGFENLDCLQIPESWKKPSYQYLISDFLPKILDLLKERFTKEKHSKMVQEIDGLFKKQTEAFRLSSAIRSVAGDIVKFIRTGLKDETFFKQKLQLNNHESTWLSQFMIALSLDDDPYLEKIWKEMHFLLDCFFLKCTLGLLQEVIDETEASKELCLAHCFFKIMEVVSPQARCIEGKVEAALESSDPIERRDLLRRSFLPIIGTLQKLFKIEPIHDISLPVQLRKPFWRFCKQSLADYLAAVYLKMNLWKRSMPVLKERVFMIHQTTYPEEASRFFAQYLRDFLPYYFAQNSDYFAEYLKVKDMDDQLKLFLSKNIKKISESESLAMQNFILPELKDYLEAIILQIFKSFSSKIYSIENIHGVSFRENFFLEVIIKLLEVTKDHFLTVNQVKKETQKSCAYKVSHEDMLKGFSKRNDLHPGITNDSNCSEKEKKLISLDKFFKELSEDLMPLTDLNNEQEWPFPPPFEKEIWSFLKGKLFPEILFNLFKQLIDPHTLNFILLNSLENFNAAIDSLEKASQSVYEYDENQVRLNKVCGELVLQLVRLVPQTLTYSILKIDGVKQMTAEVLGGAVRRLLKQWSLIAVINHLFYTILPQMHEGQWEGRRGLERFIPKSILNLPTVSTQVFENSRLHFTFPKTEKGKEIYQKAQQSLKRMAEKKLIKGLKMTISKQLLNAIKEGIGKLWERFQDTITQILMKHFGNEGAKIKNLLDEVFHFIFIRGIWTILSIILYPLFKVAWFITEECYFSAKAKGIVKDLHLPIHESLVFRMTDTLIDALKDKEHSHV